MTRTWLFALLLAAACEPAGEREGARPGAEPEGTPGAEPSGEPGQGLEGEDGSPAMGQPPGTQGTDGAGRPGTNGDAGTNGRYGTGTDGVRGADGVEDGSLGRDTTGAERGTDGVVPGTNGVAPGTDGVVPGTARTTPEPTPPGATGTTTGTPGVTPGAETPGTAQTTPGTTTTPGTQVPGTGQGAEVDAREATRQVLTDLHQAHLHGIALARLAAVKSNDPAIRSFAEQETKDHTQADADLVQLAQAQGFSWDDADQSRYQEQVAAVERLRGLDGVAFEQAYIQEVGQAHDQALTLIETSMTTIQEPAIRNQLEQSRSVYQAHRDRARQLRPGDQG